MRDLLQHLDRALVGIGPADRTVAQDAFDNLVADRETGFSEVIGS